jgi:ribonuclease HI
LDSFQAEVVACQQGLQAAIDLGVTRVHMETDGIQMQQAIQSKSWELSAVGGLIEEIQEITQLNCVVF